MGRDAGDRTGQRLARLTGLGALSHDADRVDTAPFPAPSTGRPVTAAGPSDGQGRTGRARHVRRPAAADDVGTAAGTGWRLAGVPLGAAVGLLVLAVVVVLLLGRGGGADEVLIGPVAAADPTTGATSDPTTGATGDPVAVATLDVVPPEGGVSPATGPVAAGPVLVHVDGAVHRPGVVELRAGDRVADAVEAAGGATGDADTRLVNLARTVVDGELVVLPAHGEQPAVGPVAGAAAGTGPPGTAPGGAAAAAAVAGPVDLNSADAAALDQLPGIGPVLAERVVAFREESGPFSAVDDLAAVRGIGPAVLAGLRDLVTV